MGRFSTDRLESKVNNIKGASEQFEKVNIDDIIDCSDNHFPLTEIEELAYDIAERGLDDNLVVGRCNKEVAEHYGVKEGQYLLISGHRRKTAIMYGNEHIDNFNMQNIMCKIKPFNSVATARYELNMANLQSRRLTSSDLMRAFTEMNELLPELEKEGMKISGRKRDWIAKMLNVSSAQVGKMENVFNNAVPEVKAKIEQGEISLNAANVIARLDKKEQKDVVENYSGSDSYEEAKKRLESAKHENALAKEESDTAHSDRTECNPVKAPAIPPVEMIRPSITMSSKTEKEDTSSDIVTTENEEEAESLETTGWNKNLVKKAVNFIFNRSINNYNLSEETRNQLKGIELMLMNILDKDASEADDFING